MAASELVLKVPLTPGPLTAVLGRDTFQVTRHDAARWLLSQQDTTGMSQQWIDMLGGLGLALKLEADGSVLMVISRPAQKLSANVGTHGHADYKDVVLTMCPLIWILKWRNEKLVSSQLYAAERPIRGLMDQARLCNFPFGNSDGGGICWGTASTNHLSLKNPLEVETLFFRSGLNEHLFRAVWLMPRQAGNTLGKWAEANGTELPVPLNFERERATTIQQVLNLHDTGQVEELEIDEPEEEEDN